MRAWMRLHVMLGVIWCGVGLISVITICIIYGRLIPDTTDVTPSKSRLISVVDTIGATFAAMLLWPLLLRDFCRDYNRVKRVL